MVTCVWGIITRIRNFPIVLPLIPSVAFPNLVRPNRPELVQSQSNNVRFDSGPNVIFLTLNRFLPAGDIFVWTENRMKITEIT